MTKKPRAHHQQGFLLIEVLFAAALLSLVIAVAAGSLAASTRALGVSKKNTRAIMLLESKLSELRHTGVNAPDQGELDAGEQLWTWRAMPAGECRGTVCPVTVFVEWDHRGATRSISATTVLPRSGNNAPEAAP